MHYVGLVVCRTSYLYSPPVNEAISLIYDKKCNH